MNEIVGYRREDEMDKEIVSYTYYKKYESDYDKPIEINQTFKMTSDMKYFKEKKVWPKMDEKALEEALAIGDIESIDTDFIIANRPTLHHIYMRESCSGFICDKILFPSLSFISCSIFLVAIFSPPFLFSFSVL